MIVEHGLPIAPSTYYAAKARGPVSDAAWAEARRQHRAPALCGQPPALRGPQAVARDETCWSRDGQDQVARLMRICGITGTVRGKRSTITTAADPVQRGTLI
ncbi:hypothetical protein MAUB_62510 (plasmid) [Mycolicibacterium aubagnense]|uniref:Transposase n=1 Tax=Mycolicibacterium aubagnense TaxID=319707 RepID=A0ABM7IMP2_9MYCO|nr:hypothetical protein MAUB_62510 [Mycolicibacterium aubagnense]